MGPDEPFSNSSILLVAAHQDDEVIGAGAQLASWRDRITIVHVTRGAPANPDDAHRAGCSSREAYAETRRREVLNALRLAGVPSSNCLEIGVGDQEAAFELSRIAAELRAIVERVRPAIVLTHPYEGGHPDHDSTAFASHIASQGTGAQVWEFTSYHAGPNGMETGRFLPHDGPQFRYTLSEKQKQGKQDMFGCFPTQAHVLKDFAVDFENFRPAPKYDFSQPPHPGLLHYEQFDWGVKGPEWRELARAAGERFQGLTHATNHS